MPLTALGEYALGFDVMRNSGKDPLRIEQVELVGARDVHLVDAFITPISDRETIGVGKAWPLSPGDLSPAQQKDWSERVPAVGPRRLDPAKQTRDWGLVLHLEVAGDRPSYKHVEVRYEAQGDAFSATSGTGLVIKKRC